MYCGKGVFFLFCPVGGGSFISAVYNEIRQGSFCLLNQQLSGEE